MDSLGKRVAAVRAEKGWDQKALAREMCRIDPTLTTTATTISTIENDKVKRPTTLHQLSLALGVNEKWLLTGKAEKYRGEAKAPIDEGISLEHVLAAVIGSYDALQVPQDEAEELAGLVLEVAEEPLTASPGLDLAAARRLLAASAARRFLKSKQKR